MAKVILEKNEDLKIGVEKHIAQKIEDEVIVRIYDGNLKHQTTGDLYKIKTEVIKENDKITAKEEIYMQKDKLTGDTVFFAIRLKPGFDIRSLMSFPQKIKVDPRAVMRINYLIMAIEFVLILSLSLTMLAPEMFSVYIEPFLNIPTLLGYSLFVFSLLLSMWREANYKRVWLGNFVVIHKRKIPLRFVLEEKEYSINPEILFIRLYESERANTTEVFGYSAADIADLLAQEIIQENKALNNKIVKLQEEIASEIEEKNKLLQMLSQAKKKYELYWELGYRERARESEAIQQMEGTTLTKALPYIFRIVLIGVIGAIIYLTLQNVSIVIPEQAVWLTYILVGLVVFLIALVFASFVKSQIIWSLGSERR